LVAGAAPLVPFIIVDDGVQRLITSIALTFLTLFVIGAARAILTLDRWWVAGLEMLGLGTAAAVAAYLSGAVVARLLAGS